MHPLQNGTQTAEKPKTNNPLGEPGYFTESGTNGRPSIPGADYFNAQIDEFKTLLAAGNVEFDRAKFNHILMAIKAVCRGISQFAEYNPERVYFTGEVCFTKTGNEVTYWQWYSNQEWTAGKNPLDHRNRHLGWTDANKPFYWISYTGDQVGMPFFWLDTTAPEWAVMEVNVDLPICMYWRLARRYPHLVSGDTINTGEIRGEFLRVLDQGRGINANRQINTPESQSIQTHTHEYFEYLTTFFDPTGGAGIITADSGGSWGVERSVSSVGGVETRPRNIARPMAIAI